MASPTQTPQSVPLLNPNRLARASVNFDVQIDPADAASDDSETDHPPELEHALSASYHQPPYFAVGQARAANTTAFHPPHKDHLSQWERDAALEQERSLLRDNQVIPPKHPRKRRSTNGSSARGILAKITSRGEDDAVSDVEAAEPATEQTPLLDGAASETAPYGGQGAPENIDKKWEEAVMAGKIKTTWQRELKTLWRYSWPLTLTFLLQYSLTTTSVVTVGQIGKNELGAVSLGTMTASITGYSVYQGLATSLDTLCAQAYGSGHKKLVGLQLQRMVALLAVMTIPIAVIWLSATEILKRIVTETETAELAGLYLKVLLFGAPGFFSFEAGKRFIQAQGIFKANLYILLIVAPINVFLHWLLVWKLNFGFIGAPIAVSITETMLPILLFLYVRFVAGYECWGGFSKAAFQNWGPMIRLALPGLAMVLAEYMAFEILTLAAARLGPTELAAQSVLSNMSVVTWQIAFSISIAAGTRIANLIGATLASAAQITAIVALVIELGVGVFNTTLLISLRNYLPHAFTKVPEVIDTVADVIPIVAAMQLFDAIAGCMNGILRGMGRQEIGGYVGLAGYYAIGLPVSFATCFGLGWGLKGLWSGVTLALILVGSTEGIVIWRTSWQRSVEDAKARNTNA